MMILTQRQLATLIQFADGEDVFLDFSFAGEEKGEVSINVGRESDRSMIRVTPEGFSYPVQDGSRPHDTNGLPCWCGVKHGN